MLQMQKRGGKNKAKMTMDILYMCCELAFCFKWQFNLSGGHLGLPALRFIP